MNMKKVIGSVMVATIVASSVGMYAGTTTAQAGFFSDLGSKVDELKGEEVTFDAYAEDGTVDGEAYIKFKVSSKKIVIEGDDEEAREVVHLKNTTRFKVKAEFSDTDLGCTVYYQFIDADEETYDDDMWTAAVPTTTGLVTGKEHQFYASTNMQNKKDYIKVVCDDYSYFIFKTNKFILDKKKPNVSGVKAGVKYTKAVTIKFSDKNGIKSAELNGEAITNGDTVSSKGEYKLVVIDTAGNKKTVRFSIKK